jgi:diguanylate cyclase (GGDEF)-like protein
MRLVRWWWRQPDHYDWFVSYLRARHMADFTRGVIVAVAAFLAAVAALSLSSAASTAGPVRTTLSLLAVLGAAGCALLWAVRWPTRRGSVLYAVVASASIGMAALGQGDPSAGLLACTALASISGYIAIFHTPELMVANLVFVTAVPAVPAAALVATHGIAQAVSEYALVLIVNVAVPFGIQVIIHALGVDLLEADRDPLTDLFHRRAFFQRLGVLVAEGGGGDQHVVIAMVDLDRFKGLNDAHGHAVGDLALVAVGRALRAHTRQGALVGRVGGEEFLVADVVDDPQPLVMGQRLCDAVAALHYPVTASVGTATVRCEDVFAAGDPVPAITALIAAADEAMYDAKRDGGNQTRHQCEPLDEPLH